MKDERAGERLLLYRMCAGLSRLFSTQTFSPPHGRYHFPGGRQPETVIATGPGADSGHLSPCTNIVKTVYMVIIIRQILRVSADLAFEIRATGVSLVTRQGNSLAADLSQTIAAVSSNPQRHQSARPVKFAEGSCQHAADGGISPTPWSSDRIDLFDRGSAGKLA